MRRLFRSFDVWLISLALAVRVGAVLALGVDGPGPRTFEHGEIAANLLSGRGFSVRFLGADGPTSQQAPFYPSLLAACYAIWGQNSTALAALELLQCVAGAALVLAVVSITRSLLPARPAAARMAGLCAALYPPHIYMVTHIQVVTWASLALALVVATVVSPRWNGMWRGAALTGVLAGWLLLIEPILALALPIVAAWRFARGRSLAGRSVRQAMGQIALTAVVSAAVIAPWIVRNALVHGELVFIKSTFGYAFWQGNNRDSLGTDKLPRPAARAAAAAHDGSLASRNQALWNARHKTFYIDDVLLKASDYQLLGRLSEPERSRLLAARAWDDIRQDPSAYASRCWRRVGYFFWFDATNPKAAHPLYRLATSAWLFLAVVGLVACGAKRRLVWPLVAIVLAVNAFHVLTITSARFRMPLEPLTFAWIGIGLTDLAMWRLLRPGRLFAFLASFPALRAPRRQTL